MRAALLLAALFSLAFSGPSLAAAARRPPPQAAKPAAPALKPAIPAGQTKQSALSGQLAPPLPFAMAPGLASLGLDMKRLDANRLGVADGGPACRQACSNRRYMCGIDDEGCAENWRQCVVQCQ